MSLIANDELFYSRVYYYCTRSQLIYMKTLARVSFIFCCIYLRSYIADAQTANDALHIAPSGNVGIGTNTPQDKLEVNGNTTINGNTSVAGKVKAASVENAWGSISLPKGVIVMYAGTTNDFDETGKGKPNTPAEGWAICNGNNETPDLRGRFIVGVSDSAESRRSPLPAGLSSYRKNDTGGEERHKLTIDEMPSHKHQMSFDSVRSKRNRWGLGLHNISFKLDDDGGRTPMVDNPDEKLDLSTVIKPTGKDIPHENRPPYYALLYVMKL